MRGRLALAILCVAWLVAGCAPASPPSVAPRPLRIMTYNIHHAEGTDGRLDVERIASEIAAQKPDLVAVQEVDVKTRRVPIDEPAELARLTGLQASFGKAIDLQGGSYGQVVLSRFPMSHVTTIRLPSQPTKEQRIAHAVEISPGGGWPTIRFVSVHLDHQSEADRTAQATALVKAMEGSPLPTLLAGDFNAAPDSPTMQTILERYDDTARPNATGPTSTKKRIDYILKSHGSPWTVDHSAIVGDRIASDHRAVVAELKW